MRLGCEYIRRTLVTVMAMDEANWEGYSSQATAPCIMPIETLSLSFVPP